MQAFNSYLDGTKIATSQICHYSIACCKTYTAISYYFGCRDESTVCFGPSHSGSVRYAEELRVAVIFQRTRVVAAQVKTTRAV